MKKHKDWLRLELKEGGNNQVGKGYFSKKNLFSKKFLGSNFSETVESVSDRSCSISRQIPVGNQSINIGEEIDRNKNEVNLLRLFLI